MTDEWTRHLTIYTLCSYLSYLQADTSAARMRLVAATDEVLALLGAGERMTLDDPRAIARLRRIDTSGRAARSYISAITTDRSELILVVRVRGSGPDRHYAIDLDRMTIRPMDEDEYCRLTQRMSTRTARGIDAAHEAAQRREDETGSGPRSENNEQ